MVSLTNMVAVMLLDPGYTSGEEATGFVGGLDVERQGVEQSRC